jgi:hypothetical protein
LGKKTLVIVAAIATPIGIYTISPLLSARVNEPLPASTSVPKEKPLLGDPSRSYVCK